MKHVFIINPAAGKRDCTARLMGMAKQLEVRHGLDVECILTRRPGHAMETVRSLAARGEPVRIYACGGDGTVNETANGIAGFENAAMTCIPVGTGNDTAALFADPENLWDGPAFPLDAIDCSGRLALTVACSGFDAQVARDVHTYGKLPLLGGQGTYILSLGVNFLVRGLDHRWTITLDGAPMPGNYVLAAVCNGRYYGLNTLIVRKVSRPAFLRFVGAYSKGLYHTLPDVARCYTAREVVIRSQDRDIVTCLDGECTLSREAAFRLSEKRVSFFGPAGCDPNATCVPLPE